VPVLRSSQYASRIFPLEICGFTVLDYSVGKISFSSAQKIMCCRIVTRLNPLAFLPIMRPVSINGARKMKLLDIDKHFDIIDFIRIHSEELYLGYKTFIRIFGPLDDTHHLIKIVAELESDYTRN